MRRLPFGAELVAGSDAASFRVWAPARRRVEVLVEGQPHLLDRDDEGIHEGVVAGVTDGTTYRYRLDGDAALPDPASRAQPEGPHGPSRVVDPSLFRWTDAAWRGPSLRDAVVYEMHVGTWTPEGTWAAATERLGHLVDLGVTIVEMMPVHDFPGRFGWGYDGVCLYAPAHQYGAPDDLRRFVDRAHALGLGVILDVVYNHLGPDGNWLPQYAAEYFTDAYQTDWGSAIDYRHGPVRDLFVGNAGYWIDEYHLDGLRFDATQNVYDEDRPVGPPHILAAMAARARAAAGDRTIWLVAENEPQEARIVRAPTRGGFGLDALWNDDYHHSARVALTGRREAYRADYAGTAQELVACVRRGYLYQGQYYAWQDQRRGTPALDLGPQAFVMYLENHDQVANAGGGERLHRVTSPGRLRALTALTLLAPSTPMLFQGQEWASSRPFVFFAHHEGELRELVRKGRTEFMRQFPSLAEHEIDDPGDPRTFELCKLDWDERSSNGAALALHRDLLALRRTDPTIAARRIDAAAVTDRLLAVRWLGDAGDDRLLVVNLGVDVQPGSFPEPLLAPPSRAGWRLLWSSEDPAYGAMGTPPPEDEKGRLRVLGDSAVLLAPRERRP